jgi:hypothetical protein
MYKCAGVFDSDPSGVVCKEEETNCDESTKECPDGSILVPDPENECKLPACPCCDPVELPCAMEKDKLLAVGTENGHAPPSMKVKHSISAAVVTNYYGLLSWV